jgi:arabinose-5-phosphate isomerase
VPLVKRLGGTLIAITGNDLVAGPRGRRASWTRRVDQEACPLNLAPTASTTAALALGDALAVALLDARGFGADDFARSHPGGALGRKPADPRRRRDARGCADTAGRRRCPAALAAMTRAAWA